LSRESSGEAIGLTSSGNLINENKKNSKCNDDPNYCQAYGKFVDFSKSENTVFLGRIFQKLEIIRLLENLE